MEIEDVRVATTLYIDFFKHSRAAYSAVKDWTWLKFELTQDFMVILVISKKNEDPNKFESARLATTLNIDFSRTQGSLTPQSRVGSG